MQTTYLVVFKFYPYIESIIRFQNSEKTFQAATAEIQSFNLQKAESLLTENLEQLNAALCPPCKDYHLTQEAYMKVVLHSGNCRVKKSLADLDNKQ